MRSAWIALPLMLAPVPAIAAPREAPQLPREFTDPAMADKLGKVAGALTRALMDLPVGEVEAAVQGREATAADRSKKVRDVAIREATQRIAHALTHVRSGLGPALLRLRVPRLNGHSSADAQGYPVIVVYTSRPGVAVPATIEGYPTRVNMTGTVIPSA